MMSPPGPNVLTRAQGGLVRLSSNVNSGFMLANGHESWN